MQLGISRIVKPDGEPDAVVGVILASIDTCNGVEVGISVKLDSPAIMFTFCVPPDVADNLAARLAVTIPEVATECREIEARRRNGEQ